MTEESALIEDLMKPVTNDEFLVSWENYQKKTLAAEWEELNLN